MSEDPQALIESLTIGARVVLFLDGLSFMHSERGVCLIDYTVELFLEELPCPS